MPKRQKLLSITVYRQGDDATSHYDVGCLSEPEDIRCGTLRQMMRTVFSCCDMLDMPFAKILGNGDLRKFQEEFAAEAERRKAAAPSPAKGAPAPAATEQEQRP